MRMIADVGHVRAWIGLVISIASRDFRSRIIANDFGRSARQAIFQT